ncbi:ADIPOR-like receptor IZH3 [Lachancea thermotolerans]
MDRLESLLPNDGAYRPRLHKLRTRGKQIVRWSKSQVAGVPAYALRKITWGAASEADEDAGDDARAAAAEPPAELFAADFDAITMVDSRPQSMLNSYRMKDAQTARWHAKTATAAAAMASGVSYVSSAATLVSSSSFSSAENISLSLPSASPARSLSSADSCGTSPVSPVAGLRICDAKAIEKSLQSIQNDAEAVAASIKFHNYEVALQLGQQRHLHYYELPFPWRENRFIIHGYRFYNSYSKSLLSVFNWYGWHNETVNIWTHLCGALYFAFLIFKGFSQTAVYQSELVPAAAKFMAFVFLTAGLECFLFSVVWHTFNGICHLKQRSNCACVDYTGITVLVTASILTTEFVTLSGSSDATFTWSLLFFTGVSAALGAVGVFMNWSPKFDRPESRPLRIAFYLLLASFGFFSYLHSRLFNTAVDSSDLIKPVFMKSLAWYIIGVVFYGTFIPERWRSDVQVDANIPTEEQLTTDLEIITKHRHIHFRSQPASHRKCKNADHKRSFKSLWWVDYFCCSHTLWHLFVLLGVIGHYTAMLEMFEKRWLRG